MSKSLAFAAALLLVLSCAGFVVAQTASNYADTPRTSGTAERTVSPEAKAEAKRLYKEGVKYGLAGLFPQAVQVLERSVKLDPQNPDAHFALGHAYFDLKQYRNAIESLKIAVALDPRDAEARDRLGLARAMLWEEDNAKLSAQRQRTAPKPQPVAEQVAMTAKVPALAPAKTPDKAPEKVAEKAPEKPPEKVTEQAVEP